MSWQAVVAGFVFCVAFAYSVMLGEHFGDVSHLFPSREIPVYNEEHHQQYNVEFSLCSEAPKSDCVVDGDTFWLSGLKIRMADVDAPEISNAACSAERRSGEAAKRRLLALLNAGPFSLISGPRDEDRYGRKLRIVAWGDQSIGEMLVDENLAQRWNGPRIDWCD